MWAELVEVLGQANVLTKADRNAMAIYCEAYAAWRKAKEAVAKDGEVLTPADGGRTYRNPWCVVQHEAETRMVTVGAMLGLDPSSRAKMRIAVVDQKTGPDKSRFFKNREQA